MTKILIVNGPNLNMTGQREEDIYGSTTFDKYLQKMRELFPDAEINYFQSNIEGEIIDHLQKADENVNGIILNAGGYTHTSVAIGDAVKAIKTPVIEVHLSNILSREDFRHKSFIAPNCIGSVFGFGLDSYKLAISYFYTN